MRIASCVFAVALACSVLVAPAGVPAEPTPARSTSAGDELARDRQELEAFEEILGVLHRTAAKRQKKEYLKLNLNLHAAMVREVEQADAKVIRARRTGEAERESRSGRHRMWTAEGRHESMNELVREAQDLLPFLQEWDRRAVARNRDILDEFFEIMITDLRASGGVWRTGASS